MVPGNLAKAYNELSATNLRHEAGKDQKLNECKPVSMDINFWKSYLFLCL